LVPNSYCFGAAIFACARSGGKVVVVAAAAEPDGREGKHEKEEEEEENEYGAKERFKEGEEEIGVAGGGEQPQWRLALQLLNQAMPARKVKPTLHCANAAVHACGRAGQWEEALGLVKAMEEANPVRPPPVPPPVPPPAVGVEGVVEGMGLAGLATSSALPLSSPRQQQQQQQQRRHLPAPDLVTYCTAFEALEGVGSGGGEGGGGGGGGEALGVLVKQEQQRAAAASVALMDSARNRGLFTRVWEKLQRKDEELEVEEALGSSSLSSASSVVDLRDCSPSVAKACVRCLLRDLEKGTVKPQNIRVVTGSAGPVGEALWRQHHRDDEDNSNSSSSLSSRTSNEGGQWLVDISALPSLADAALERLIEKDAVFKKGFTVGRSFFHQGRDSEREGYQQTLGQPPQQSQQQQPSSQPLSVLPSEVVAFLDACSGVVELGRNTRRRLAFAEEGRGVGGSGSGISSGSSGRGSSLGLTPMASEGGAAAAALGLERSPPTTAAWSWTFKEDEQGAAAGVGGGGGDWVLEEKGDVAAHGSCEEGKTLVLEKQAIMRWLNSE
jgi:pentatricopeptide repeat protein